MIINVFEYNDTGGPTRLLRKTALADNLNSLWLMADTIEKRQAAIYVAVNFGLTIKQGAPGVTEALEDLRAVEQKLIA